MCGYRLLIASVLAGLVLIAPTSRGAKVDVSASDGFDPAFADKPQHRDLLASFAVRPPWRVAGVDYAVGRPQGIKLKKPDLGNLPAGVELRTDSIHVLGRDVRLDGFDLSGLTVMIEDSAAGVVKISNCEAENGVVIRSTVDAKAHLVVDRCTLDGGGMRADPNYQTIKVWCPLTVLHTWIKNSPGGIQSGAALVAKYNLLEGFAWSPGAHANAIYVRGTHARGDQTRIAYNVVYSQSTRNAQGFPVGIGAAIAFFGDGGDFYDSVVSHNVLVSALPGAASYLIGFYVEAGASATGGVIADNYFASANGFSRRNSGAFGLIYPGSHGRVEARVTSNVDMNAPGRPRARDTVFDRGRSRR
ncbi:MAG TPA: hypothetical protein VN715_19110 [Roseiarcus sp.]|nr:hypothetical protein [Roseiarcus sp.]